MALDTLKFVDSIASSPTTRLDLNDGSLWTVRDLSAPPPRIRRSMVSNAMTDGAYVSSSSYDARTLFVEIDLITTTQDLGATELQKLARELDRPTNFLMYQPNTLTKPVFFKTWRSDFSDVVDVRVVGAYRQLSIELMAEPFALGLRETISVGTVNNDPAAGSNGCYFDISGIKGDVAAPMVLACTLSATWPPNLFLSVKQDANSTDLPGFIQCESMSTNSETANPGGGPDAAMSGTGTNNFVRTTFAGSPDLMRLFNVPSTDAGKRALTGRFRLLVAVRRSSAVGAIRIGASIGGTGVATPDVTLPLTTNRVLVDLGVFDRPFVSDQVLFSAMIYLHAARDSGASTLDWDCVFTQPADVASMVLSGASATDIVIDGEQDRSYLVAAAANLFTTGTNLTNSIPIPVTGGYPMLAPGVTNRFFLVRYDAAANTFVKGDTLSAEAHYLPRYLYVRPSAT